MTNPIRLPQLGAETVPSCETCGAPTRLVGVERFTGSLNGELATYQCNTCANVQAHPRTRHARGT